MQYPVVLVHGIARNDHKEYHAWGRIPDALKEHGIDVYFGNTDAWGGIMNNAELLKETIDSIIKHTNYEKVNIIAHSKGGIDSRYLIWKHQYGDKVASLTTIATPHQGSEIADLFYNTNIIHSKMVKQNLHSIGKLYGDISPDMYTVNAELTTENMIEFSAKVTMDPRVYYQSVFTVMQNPYDDPVFSRSNMYIKNRSGENDGVVSRKSATFGNNVIRISGSISHEQIIDQGGKKIRGTVIPEIYLELAKDLSRKGF